MKITFTIPKHLWAAVIAHNLPALQAAIKREGEDSMCKHDWLEKPDYNEKRCCKCGKEEMFITRKELLAMPMEKRREILAKQSADFVKEHPDYFKDLL
jgi:hypothetical protein